MASKVDLEKEEAKLDAAEKADELDESAKCRDDVCGNFECDECVKLPRFRISITRVKRVTHSRDIKAATKEEALRIYDGGTAWPSSYDESDDEIISEDEAVIVELPPKEYNDCWHKLGSP